MLLQLLNKNILNVFSSLHALSYFFTPYAILLVTYIMNGLDYVIIISTWIIVLFFNSFFIIIIIKKRDIKTGHNFLYYNYKKLMLSYYIFALIISFPYYIFTFFIYSYLTFILLILSLPTNFIILTISFRIDKNVLLKLNENVLSALLIILSIGIVLIIDFVI